MKTLGLIFGTIVLFFSTSFGADFALTMGDYRAQIKRRLNVDITNTTFMADSVMNQLIREAIITVNPQIAGVKVTKSIVTNYSQASYKIDSTVVDIAQVWWRSNDTVRPMIYTPMEKWGALTHQNTYGGDDPYLTRPSVFDMTDDSLYLFPTPSQVDTVFYIGSQKITGISTKDTVLTVPQMYRIPILDWATYLVALSKQNPTAMTWKVQADSSISRMGR